MGPTARSLISFSSCHSGDVLEHHIWLPVVLPDVVDHHDVLVVDPRLREEPRLVVAPQRHQQLDRDQPAQPQIGALEHWLVVGAGGLEGIHEAPGRRHDDARGPSLVGTDAVAMGRHASREPSMVRPSEFRQTRRLHHRAARTAGCILGWGDAPSVVRSQLRGIT